MEIRTAGSNPENSFHRPVEYSKLPPIILHQRAGLPSAYERFETAPIIAELIQDELESSELWELTQYGRALNQKTFQLLSDKEIALCIAVEEGIVRFFGKISIILDPETDLLEEDNLEQLLNWIHEGGDLPICKASFRTGR